ncbi:serine/threonine-protein kinase [Acrocarpospora catenulata]|uniref:serine/threonine-protein kinase n=1 Tax=Acrocarpospora catenulata TaxID=2836182 RepID=UPI001BD98F78|nr:serine/threonine-protein kinase [Acrocarpospora catenulata]
MGTPGQLIVKRYRLVRALGQGSTGIVWEGHDTLLDRTVAIREVLLPTGLRENRRLALTQRVAREVRQAERLRHPNVAAVYDVAEEDGRPWIVMELCRSRSLDGIVASDGPLAPGRAAVIARQVLAALTVAHAAGVRHGDVRPANILIGHDGRVLLADFGVSTLAADAAFTPPDRSPAHGEAASATRSAAAFLAPERTSGEGPRDASDLWSLGASLYLAVTGRPPLALRSAGKPGQPASGPDVSAAPEALRPVLTGLLARDPKRRLAPDAADRMLAEFEPPPPPPEVKPRRGRARLIAVGAAAVLLAGAVGGWALFRPEPAVTEARAEVTATPAPASLSSASPSPSPVNATRLRLAWYEAPTGWRAAVPRKWRLERTEYSLWWLDPDGRAQLNVEVTNQSGTDPLGALHEAEAILYPNVKNYEKLRLRSVSSKHGTAADWEFTWLQQKTSVDTHLVKGVYYHQYRRVISTGTTTSVLTWTTMADDWDRLRPTLIRVFRMYEPPKDPA